MHRHLPNLLTSLRFPLTGLFLYGFLQAEIHWHIVATIVFFIGILTDWLDGKLARQMGRVTKIGSFLDPLADKVMVIAGFYAIFATPGFEWGAWRIWMLVGLGLIVLRELGITVLRTFLVRGGQPLATSFLGKLKTTVQMVTLIIAFVGLNLRELYAWDASWFESLVGAGVMLSAVIATVSGFVYLRNTKRTSAI